MAANPSRKRSRLKDDNRDLLYYINTIMNP